MENNFYKELDMGTKYFKSPMNYIGNKYKLLPQILPLFPTDIDIFVDMFCGGLDVSLNVDAENKICNDLENHLIDFYSNILSLSGEEVHKKVLEVVEKYNLSMTNQEGFLKLREDYNKENDWVKFYGLIAHSFNHQLRFNKSGQFNMPFGKDRSCYNKALQTRLQEFVNRIDDKYDFYNWDFRKLKFDNLTDRSFVYCDPPYLITTATYNENGGWTEDDERDLLDLLDTLNNQGVKFGLSNVYFQNGKSNEILGKWMEKYTVHKLDFNYGNSSYHKIDRSKIGTEEVFVCNY